MRAKPVRKAHASPKFLNPQDIDVDIDNPRHEDEDQIQSDPSFVQLRESVSKFGVLVPLVVRPSEDDADRWVLIDGERRLHAAKRVNLPQVPVHIVSGEITDALSQAFHIHTLRKQWSKTAQVRAIKRMIDCVTSEDKELTQDSSELLKRIGELTGFKRQTVNELVRTANLYTEETLEEIDQGNLQYSHLVQNEDSFINYIKANFKDLLEKLGEQKIREVMLQKARRKILTDTRILMDELVPVFNRVKTTAEKRYLKHLLTRFLQDKEMRVETVVQGFNRKYPCAKEDLFEMSTRTSEVASELSALLSGLDFKDLQASYPKAARSLGSCLTELRKQLTQALRRLSSKD